MILSRCYHTVRKRGVSRLLFVAVLAGLFLSPVWGWAQSTKTHRMLPKFQQRTYSPRPSSSVTQYSQPMVRPWYTVPQQTSPAPSGPPLTIVGPDGDERTFELQGPAYINPAYRPLNRTYTWYAPPLPYSGKTYNWYQVPRR